MPVKKISSGVVHDLPQDLRKLLLAQPDMLVIWEDLTPLARNEWICWIEDAKKDETRTKRMERAYEDMLGGKRRPCCWPGCGHR